MLMRLHHAGRRAKIGLVELIIFALVCLGLFWYFTRPPARPYHPDEDLAEKCQMSADEALKLYLDTVWDFLHTDTPGKFMKPLCTAVTKDDWLWFEDNYSEIFKKRDFARIGGALAADQNIALSRLLILRSLLENGVTARTPKQKSRKEESSNLVVYVLSYPDDFGKERDHKVEVGRDGKYWKVKNFAGGLPVVRGDKLPRIFEQDMEEDSKTSATQRLKSPTEKTPPSPSPLPGAGAPPSLPGKGASVRP